MKVLLLIVVTVFLSTVDGQLCRASFDESITGQCSSVDTCRETILSIDCPEHNRCCLNRRSQELKIDLGIVLDAGKSIGNENYQLELEFTKNLLRQVNVGRNKTHVGIINYSDHAETLTWLDRDYDLQGKIQAVDEALYYPTDSNTARALQQADVLFSYERGRRKFEECTISVILIITDGKSNDQGAAIRAAKVLKQKDILLISIGVGDKPHLGELRAMCSPPKSVNYFALSDYNALVQRLNQLRPGSCSKPTILPSNTTITIEIIKDEYKFLKVEIIQMGNKILITVILFNGNVKLFYSFTNQNPIDPDDSIDYKTKIGHTNKSSWTRLVSYFQRSSNKADVTENNRITLVIDKPDDDQDFVYIGIKGIANKNKFQVKIDDCEKVNCKSNANKTEFSVISIIFFSLFLRYTID